MAPNAVPLRSKCADWEAQGPPGQKSVMTTLTGRPEQWAVIFIIYEDDLSMKSFLSYQLILYFIAV